TPNNRGCLLLVADYAMGVQWQPPQMALRDLRLLIQAPDSAKVALISPADFRYLVSKRVPGGLEITLPEFSATALVLATTDEELLRSIETEVLKIKPMAVNLAIQQAQLQIDSVADTCNRLALDGHVLAEKDKI